MDKITHTEKNYLLYLRCNRAENFSDWGPEFGFGVSNRIFRTILLKHKSSTSTSTCKVLLAHIRTVAIHRHRSLVLRIPPN